MRAVRPFEPRRGSTLVEQPHYSAGYNMKCLMRLPRLNIDSTAFKIVILIINFRRYTLM